jgi:general stress protein YciG
MLLVIQPGSSAFTWAALLPLGSAVFAAIYQLLTSRLAGVDVGATSLFIGGSARGVVHLGAPGLHAQEAHRGGQADQRAQRAQPARADAAGKGGIANGGDFALVQLTFQGIGELGRFELHGAFQRWRAGRRPSRASAS